MKNEYKYSHQKITYRILAQFLNKLEINYDLFNIEIDGVYFWKIIRIILFNEILVKKGLIDTPHPSEYKSILVKSINRLIEDYTIIKRNANKINEKSDIIIFNSSRKFNMGNSLYDLYFFDIKSRINDSDDFSFVEFEINSRINKNSKSNNQYYARTTTLKRHLYLKFYKIVIDQEKEMLIKKISMDIFKEYGIEINLYSLIKRSIAQFNLNYKYYKKLLEKIKPMYIFIICSYGKEALICAAQDLGIHVIEYQHGTMSRYHFGYDFPHNKIPYFPNEIYLFGEYWKGETRIPLESNSIKIKGYSYLNSTLNKTEHIKEIKNSVLFISHGTIANELSKIAFEYAVRNKDFSVFYKLHPSEYQGWEDNYPLLKKAVTLPNFNVIKNEKLHELLVSSEYLVGVASTVIFEGLSLGVKTILLDLPGVEHMNNLIENKIVMFAKNSNELESYINNFNTEKYSRLYFFDSTKEIVLPKRLGTKVTDRE